MKLAEALQERADLNARIEQLKERMVQNALMQEGIEPSEDPHELASEFEECVSRLEVLVNLINLTNVRTVVDGKTLTEHIAHRDCLKLRIGAYRNFLREAGQPPRRAMRSEIRILSTVDVREEQKKLDALSGELRKTDTLIQSANWTTDIVEK